jgi:predicted DNA-binding transcriptional regulator AlpA
MPRELALEEEPISLIGERDLAKRLAISISFVRKLRRLKRGPRFLKLGRAVRYSATDIADWLNSQAIRTDEQTCGR